MHRIYIVAMPHHLLKHFYDQSIGTEIPFITMQKFVDQPHGYKKLGLKSLPFTKVTTRLNVNMLKVT